MKYIESTNQIGIIIKKFPECAAVLESLGILKFENKETLTELALKNKIPLQILLNNLSKKSGLPVKWPKVEGMKNEFSASSGLRSGKPEGIKKIIAIHSGKGGVGKTMVATSLAVFLQEKGYKCGLLDLDIDCPNVYKNLGLADKAVADSNKKIIPLEYKGLKILSMGAIQDRENLAIMWRGPILAKAIDQMIYDTAWGELDLLIVDLPPGTGDAPLTLFNMFKPEQMLIVTTPHHTALTDAEKSIDMCKTLGVKVGGVIGNMTGEIFGNISNDWINKNGVKLLAEIKLNKTFAEQKFWEMAWPLEMDENYKLLAKLIFG